MTSNPVTKINVDSGDDWVVRGNFIHDSQKGLSDFVSYGAFLKCGGQRGVLERNLVLCARDTSGGTRIGLSLGGGGCANQFCQPSFSSSVTCVEHTGGIVRNNIVANCSDVGVYVKNARESHVVYNTLIATSGIDFHEALASGEARGNVLGGVIRNRNGATGTFANNVDNVTAAQFADWYVDPLRGDLRQKGNLAALLGAGIAVPQVLDDYCGRTRTMPFDVGALQHSLGDCATSSSPDGGASVDDLGSVPGGGDGDGGSMAPTTPQGGCACTVGGSEAGAPFAIVALLFAAVALRRRRQ
jgi:MYXO-CTERM domain-containing protein